jgi:phage baseplate assembly protein W
MNNYPFPFAFDGKGRSATADYPQHVRQMIEQLLFTNPGERPNRPDFGSGLLSYVHSPASEVVAAALQANVQGALQRWLGDVIDVHDLEVQPDDNKLIVHVTYSLRRTSETRTDSFERSVA